MTVLGWPLAIAATRVAVSIGGAGIALRLGYGLSGVFGPLGAGLVLSGVLNAVAFASGATGVARGMRSMDREP